MKEFTTNADAGTWVSGDMGSTPAAVDHLEIAFGDYNVTIATADATSPGTFAAAANVEQDAYTFSVVTTDDGDGTLSYTLKAVANQVGAVATADIPTIKAIDANGNVITDGLIWWRCQLGYGDKQYACPLMVPLAPMQLMQLPKLAAQSCFSKCWVLTPMALHLTV